MNDKLTRFLSNPTTSLGILIVVSSQPPTIRLWTPVFFFIPTFLLRYVSQTLSRREFSRPFPSSTVLKSKLGTHELFSFLLSPANLLFFHPKFILERFEVRSRDVAAAVFASYR